MKKIIILIFSVAAILYADIKIAVSILPQEFFVKKIAGDLADVEVMVKPGASPATYSVKPSQLKALKDTKVYFAIGVPFEKAWLERFQSVNPSLKIVDSGKYIKRVPMQDEEEKHTGLDPHIWLSPPLVILQARAIAETLSKIDPANASKYIKNYQKFVSQTASLDAELLEKSKDIKQKEFIVFHPSFGYFARAYGLKQIAIEKEGKEPTLKYIQKIIEFAKKRGIKKVFVEPQFSHKSAKYIAKQIKGEVIIVDPLAYDWDKNIKRIAKAFENSY